ncbi:hypothetical protein ABBQ38_004472 [Trebouxia sp. C0009 RCD-2024]
MWFGLGNQNSVLLEASSTGNLRKVLQAIEKTGAADANRKGQDAWTPLHYAACNGHLQITEALLQNGADSNATEKTGRTPLHLAARNGHTQVVACLVKAQAVVDSPDDEGMTPLALAAAKGQTLAAGELIWGHADVNATVQDGASPLHLAAGCGHAAVVQLLLQKGADSNAQDWDGYTPLMEAAAQGHSAVAKQLLRAGADTTKLDKTGASAVSIADAEGHAQLAQLLRHQTDARHTSSSPACSQASVTPSAPPWQPQLPHQGPALPQSNPPHTSSCATAMSPPQQGSSSARSASVAARTGAVAYPAVYTSSSQQPWAEASGRREATSGLPLRSMGSVGTHQGGQLGQGGEQDVDSGGRQGEAPQPEGPQMGYVPAALSFVLGKLQAAVPDMLRPAPPPVRGPPAPPSSAQRSEQHIQHHSGPYGLGDDTDEDDERQHTEATTDSMAGSGQALVLSEQLRGLQLQEEQGRPLQSPAPAQGVSHLQGVPPPPPGQPMCRLFSYEELQGMCNGVHVWQLFRHSSSPFKGTMQHQDGTTTDVMIHWQTVARADQEPSRFREWLDEMSQLQHPHVLPLIGACLDPPAIVVPFMQNGSLDGALRGTAPPGGGPPLAMALHWRRRICLAAACAQALSYLHSHPTQLCLHELSASNVLLDDGLMPQLSGHFSWHGSMAVTQGDTGAAVVRSLGLIMLQLLTSREAGALLQQDVEKHLQGHSLAHIVDPSSGRWQPQLADQFASLAIRCTNCRTVGSPHLTQVMPQLTALAAEAAAASEAAPARAASLSTTPSDSRESSAVQADKDDCPWFNCPISLVLMEEPVVAADGHTYDRAFIQQWFDKGNRTSPYTGARLLDLKLTPNYSIKSAISEWQQKRHQPAWT